MPAFSGYSRASTAPGGPKRCAPSSTWASGWRRGPEAPRNGRFLASTPATAKLCKHSSVGSSLRPGCVEWRHMTISFKIDNLDQLPDGGPLSYRADKRGFEIGREQRD